MNFRLKVVVSLFVLFLFVSGIPALAQSGSVALSGRVTDPTGLAIVGAKVNAINEGTNVSYATQTNDTGLYNLPSLPPGKYRIEVEKEGFQEIVKPDVDLHVAEAVSIDFSLQVGAMAQTVTVQAGAPLVNTTTSSLGGLVEEQQLENLPLNGRNYIALTLMEPGVTPDVNEQKNGTYTGSWFSSNGAPIRSNNFMMDGAIMQDQYGGSTADFSGRTLGLDGIQEYRVLTNSIPAEYGLTMGSQTVMVSKGGTNKFHGSVFDYLRNSALDAPNYFDTPTAANNFRSLPPYRRNNFGGSLGGPIKKDKTFFFANYEGVRESLGVTNVNTVPAAACHGPAGTVVWNGSGTRPAGSIGPCTQLGANPTGNNTNSVTISPVIAPLLALFPVPNLANNQETVPYSQPDSDNFGQIRVDHTFSDRDSIFGRYTIDDDNIVLSLPYSQYFNNPKLTRHQFITVSENHIFSASLLNNVRVSFSRTAANRYGTDPLTGSQYQFVPGSLFPGIGQLNVGGLTLFGPSPSPKSPTKQNIVTGSDDVTYTRGNHSLKLGFSVNNFRIYNLNSTGSQGTIIFSGLATFLAGKTNSYSGSTPGSILDRTFDYYDLGFYVQDDWRVRRNFTLNVGLRYEPAPGYYTEVHGVSSTLVNRLTDATPTVGPLFAHNPTLHDFSPRLGFAWDVFGNGKTSVRGGAALLYDVTNLTSSNNLSKSQPPFSTATSVSGTTLTSLPLSFPPPTNTSSIVFNQFDYYLKQPRLYTENLTVEQQLPFSIVLGVSYAGSRGIHLVGDQEGNPNIPQMNPAFPGGLFWPAATVRQNPHWSSMTWTSGDKDSVFNALEVNVTKRLSKGLSFQSAYTWAKSIDDAQGGISDCTASTAVGSNPYDFRFDRGQSCFNAINTWVFNFIYKLPDMEIQQPVLRTIANGWGIMGIYTAHNGFPFNPWETTERARTGVLAGGANPPVDRPDWVAGRNPGNTTRGTSSGCAIAGGTGSIPAGTPLGTATHYYDPCAFTLQPVGTLGTVGRDSLIGPGFSGLDFAIQKDTKPRVLGEAGNVQFRAEFFNILNHPNFSEPNEAVFPGTLTDATENPNSSAGQITSTVSTSRQIEFSLKLVF